MRIVGQRVIASGMSKVSSQGWGSGRKQLHGEVEQAQNDEGNTRPTGAAEIRCERETYDGQDNNTSSKAREAARRNGLTRWPQLHEVPKPIK